MIIGVDPPNWEESRINAVQVDSDAPKNLAAVAEVEAWADEHGFERVEEPMLRLVFRDDGRRVYRGVCVRRTGEIERSAKRFVQAVDENRQRLSDAG